MTTVYCRDKLYYGSPHSESDEDANNHERYDSDDDSIDPMHLLTFQYKLSLENKHIPSLEYYLFHRLRDEHKINNKNWKIRKIIVPDTLPIDSFVVGGKMIKYKEYDGEETHYLDHNGWLVHYLSLKKYTLEELYKFKDIIDGLKLKNTNNDEFKSFFWPFQRNTKKYPKYE